MDKKSITGLLIIAGILIIFSLFQSPPKETPKKDQKGDKDQTGQIAQSVDDSTTEKTVSSLVPKRDEKGLQIVDSVKGLAYTDTITGRDTFIVTTPEIATDSLVSSAEEEVIKPSECDEQIITLENDKLIVEISNQGGRISSVFLKEYQTYNDWQGGNNKPLQLFDKQSTYGVEFLNDDKKQNTADYCFSVVESDKNSATVEMINEGKKVGFKYALGKGKYDVDFNIYFKGFNDKEATDLAFTSDIKLLSTEKHLASQRRVATIFYKYREDSYDYLSIAGDDDQDIEQNTQWVAFKQSYFSAIIMSDDGFEATKDSKIEIVDLKEDTTYLKEYKANLGLGVENINNTINLKWYFGPNDYDILTAYENGSEDIVDLGWGLFRWINVYAIRPLFNFFLSWGIGAGLAILLLTIIVKIFLSPVNYKMYKSSAMMKVLKPEIDKIQKKFPKKEDAMKKQQEIMALYRETGVNPMSGCVPMLIQMPILFAIFRLFPSAIELRQHGFLWAEDLSTYDSIWNFGFNVPLYGDHMSLFTLLMAATTLAYTHYNSQNMTQPTAEGMPNMKVIMYIFPILMIFFFNSYSSGLSYYYFISTLMTMGIMFAIKRFMIDDEKIQAKIDANREDPNRKKKKSKFAQRLEEAQKMQQERSRNKGK